MSAQNIVEITTGSGIEPRRPATALQPNEAIVRGTCPVCKQAATLWVWIERVTVDEARPRGMALAGVVTDLVHDTHDAAIACGGLE